MDSSVARQYDCSCDLCGNPWKSKSPFAKICPSCKVVRFKKPGAEIPIKKLPNVQVAASVRKTS